MANFTEGQKVHVFVDDSNLFIEGQKYTARERNLHVQGVTQDPNSRVDFGNLLHLISKTRYVAEALLYGSEPPERDSVWKSAERKNFRVVKSLCGPQGKEKEVDMKMGCDITERACEYKFTRTETEIDNITFVIVTGDRDFKTPVIKALHTGIQVELWAWRSCMSNDYQDMAAEYALLSVSELDTIAKHFTFTKEKPTTLETYRNTDYSYLTDTSPKHRSKVEEAPVANVNPGGSHSSSPGASCTTTTSDRYDDAEWTLVPYKSRRKREKSSTQTAKANYNDKSLSRRRSTSSISKTNRCRYGTNCSYGERCSYFHTDEEKEIIRTRHFANKQRKKLGI